MKNFYQHLNQIEDAKNTRTREYRLRAVAATTSVWDSGKFKAGEP
jgi:hypothetical protein